MEILKTIRHKFGLSQHEMATLLHLSRDHYAMVETGRRLLPQEPAKRFATLLPIFLQEGNKPVMPKKAFAGYDQSIQTEYLKAKQSLFIAEKALKKCENEINKRQNLADLLKKLPGLKELTLTPHDINLLDETAYKNNREPQVAKLNEWLLLFTQFQLITKAVEAYKKILPTQKR